MKPIPPYKAGVFNIADQSRVGHFWTNQVPRRGEQLHFFGRNGHDERKGDGYHMWFLWTVEQVVWGMAEAGSRGCMDLARQTDAPPDGYGICQAVELFVYPTQGPHFIDTPAWAKAAAPNYHGSR